MPGTITTCCAGGRRAVAVEIEMADIARIKKTRATIFMSYDSPFLIIDYRLRRDELLAFGARKGFLDRIAQAFRGIVRQDYAVDVKGRRHVDAIVVARFHITPHNWLVLAGIEFGVEALPIQTNLRCVLLQRINVQRVLILEQEIDVLPELPLSLGGFRGLSGLEGVLMPRR